MSYFTKQFSHLINQGRVSESKAARWKKQEPQERGHRHLSPITQSPPQHNQPDAKPETEESESESENESPPLCVCVCVCVGDPCGTAPLVRQPGSQAVPPSIPAAPAVAVGAMCERRWYQRGCLRG